MLLKFTRRRGSLSHQHYFQFFEQYLTEVISLQFFCGIKDKKKLDGLSILYIYFGFPGDAVGKNPPAGDAASIPGLERFPGEGNGNLLQCSCLGKSMDRGAWRTAVCGVRVEHD